MGTHPIFESDFDCLTDLMEPDLHDLLKLHKALSVTANNRIRCAITGHEMPLRKSAVEQHIGGKKFQRLAKEWKTPTEVDESRREHLEKNTKNEAMLYCKLTGRTIKDEEIHIQRHIHGKKFLKALDHWNECQKSETEFRPLRQWGSRTKAMNEFYEELENDEGESDDDLTDLYPWMKEKQEEKDSGVNEMEVIETEEPSKSRKRAKKPNEKSVPNRRKKNKMEIG